MCRNYLSYSGIICQIIQRRYCIEHGLFEDIGRKGCSIGFWQLKNILSDIEWCDSTLDFALDRNRAKAHSESALRNEPEKTRSRVYYRPVFP
jgi:hypothetical protein